MCIDSQCLWIYNKLIKHGGLLTLLNMADKRFFPVNVSYTVYIQRNIKKQRKEKKIILKLEFSRWQRQKLTPYTTMNYKGSVYDYFKQLVPHVRPNDINS